MAQPTTPTLSWKLEQWAIELIQSFFADPPSIVHHDEDTPANVTRIVCTGTLGDREMGGLKPWNVQLEVEVFVHERDAGLMDDIMASVTEAFTEFPVVSALSYFEFLDYIGEESEERDNLRNTRHRVRTFNFFAIEVPEIIMAGDEGTMAGSETDMAGSGSGGYFAGDEAIQAGDESIQAGVTPST